jgi:MFS superfamily sulfate permease-like transporter
MATPAASGPASGPSGRPLAWLAGYRPAFLLPDAVAGVTLAAYAVPQALAYATLAGVEPVVGIYGFILGGLGYALLGSSPHLAIGPTSARGELTRVAAARADRSRPRAGWMRRQPRMTIDT